MSARESAWNILRQWTIVGSPPLVPERGEKHALWDALDARDRAFAFDLVTGVIRWRGLLDAVIASRLRGPVEQLDPAVQAILWLGAYQLLIQGGTADYAAVDTSVVLAKQFAATSKAAGLVNAVLRGITRLQPRRKNVAAHALSRRTFALDFSTQVGFSEDIFPDPITALSAHLAATRSHPMAFVEHLRGLFDDATVAALLLRNNQRPVIALRADTLLAITAESGLIPLPTAEHFFLASAGWNDAIARLVESGALSPQDPTAARPVRRLRQLVDEKRLPKPQRILDLCAGLGTKSIQLARAFPEAHITAADIDAHKLARLAARAQSIGLTNIHGLTLTGHTDQAVAGAPFDQVIVDAPCSNTGVMARRIQSRWRWPALDHAALHQLQSRLLNQAAASLAPVGTLLYSTCSVDSAENHDRIIPWLNANQLVTEERTLPSMHDKDCHDGGYFALISLGKSPGSP